ncbi:hypothetical protein [Parahaliea aestuarii]|uniref:Sulfur globule protein n=1 Tax=Parahaliea aestuarii TaxID=1852021 RepID=A0A5C8ZT19_9GAMM|nr:hypothetical protein [Parahaliea aestuarii]TXS90461.1 hypothetical protein FVW59_14055 [Parahaliea aestuarii]
MKKRYLAFAAVLALPLGQANADVMPRDQALFEEERHPASLPTANYRGGKWHQSGNRWGGYGHGYWGGAWGGGHGQGCRKVISWVMVGRHPIWGFPFFRPKIRKVCPSPH